MERDVLLWMTTIRRDDGLNVDFPFWHRHTHAHTTGKIIWDYGQIVGESWIGKNKIK